MNPAETLRAAAQRVREGWCQRSLHDQAGGVCAIGALNTVTHGHAMWKFNGMVTDLDVVGSVIARALTLPLEPGFINRIDGEWQAVAVWNNGSGQTAENVALGLEYAALVYEQEQEAKVEAVREASAATPVTG